MDKGKVSISKQTINVTGKKIKEIKEMANKGSFIYLDPPYYPISQRKDGKISPYKLYNGNDFTPVDFVKLKNRCDELTIVEVPFILSNVDCDFIRELFKDYIFIKINEARVMKRGKGKGSRPPDKCLLITNYRDPKDFKKACRNTGHYEVKEKGK